FSVPPPSPVPTPDTADPRPPLPPPCAPVPPRSASRAPRAGCRRSLRTTIGPSLGHGATRAALALRRGGRGPTLRVARAVRVPARPLEKTELVRRPYHDIHEPADEGRAEEQVGGPLGQGQQFAGFGDEKIDDFLLLLRAVARPLDDIDERDDDRDRLQDDVENLHLLPFSFRFVRRVKFSVLWC